MLLKNNSSDNYCPILFNILLHLIEHKFAYARIK